MKTKKERLATYQRIIDIYSNDEKRTKFLELHEDAFDYGICYVMLLLDKNYINSYPEIEKYVPTFYYDSNNELTSIRAFYFKKGDWKPRINLLWNAVLDMKAEKWNFKLAIPNKRTRFDIYNTLYNMYTKGGDVRLKVWGSRVAPIFETGFCRAFSLILTKDYTKSVLYYLPELNAKLSEHEFVYDEYRFPRGEWEERIRLLKEVIDEMKPKSIRRTTDGTK